MTDSVLSAAFSPDGKRIVTASRGQDGAAVGRRDRQADRRAAQRPCRMSVSSAAFSPDGKRIVTASEDKTARLWDAETGKPIGEPLKGHDGYRVRARRSAPTASASSPRLRTTRRGCGTPRPASRSASRSQAMRIAC